MKLFVSALLMPLSLWAANSDLQIGIIQEWDNIHPVSYQTAATESILQFMFRDVVYRDASGKILPNLAVSIPKLKNKQAVWTLNDQAKWSDGTPITCADWQLGWQVGSSDFVSKTEKNIYSKITKIEWDAKTPKKCTVTYATDEWTFDRDLPPVLPSHLEKKIFDTTNTKVGTYEQSSNYVKNPTLKGLYSGPYQVVEYKIGSHIIFEANPYFFGKKPTLKRIILKHVASTSTLKSYLMSKEISGISAVGFPPDLALDFAADSSLKDFTVHFNNGPIFQGLFINNEDALLKNLYIREALALAINKKELTKAFLGGKLNPAETIISENDLAFSSKPAVYNPKKAEELLEKNGWVKDTSGVRKKDGKPLEVEFKTSAGIKLYETLQVSICDYFKRVGVLCKIKNEPPRILLGDSVPKGNFQIALFGNTTYPDTSLKGLYHSDDIPSDKNAWAGGNVLRFKSKEMDQLLEKYDKEWSQSKRATILKKIDEILMSQKAVIPIYHRREALVLPKALSGVEQSATGTGMAKPENWKL
ncbi:peptide ABC transporter substrate-binding protein [Pseudobdellovibrio sp. HCB154]|uniref:peptide ABC transporter substrate-binding protein n=1 Tax=Pseudobdellovibrio sp. HCB154 TaxID=3386277 RepID=UPI0039174E67